MNRKPSKIILDVGLNLKREEIEPNAKDLGVIWIDYKNQGHTKFCIETMINTKCEYEAMAILDCRIDTLGRKLVEIVKNRKKVKQIGIFFYLHQIDSIFFGGVSRGYIEEKFLIPIL